MTPETAGILNAENLAAYASHEVPDGLDLWPTVRARVQSERARPRWVLLLPVLRHMRLAANVAATVLALTAAAVVLYFLFLIPKPFDAGQVPAAPAPSILPVPANPEVTPQLGRIVFHSSRDGNSGIYVMDPDGSNVTRLTNNSAVDVGARCSPDGTRIVFASNRHGDFEIFIMDADGSDQTRLTDNTFYEAWPSWSPDGRRIFFSSDRDSPPGPEPERGYRPGRELRWGIMEIYVMDADGSSQTRLTDTPVGEWYPDLSPDGRRITFTSGSGPASEVFVMDVDGSNLTRLTNDDNFDETPTWSPDGTKIAYKSGPWDGTGRSDTEIIVMDADGSNQTNITNHPAKDFYPKWSPDGTKIVFHSNRDGNGEIYVMDSDGTNQTRITNNPALDWWASWCSVAVP